jgi:hypothetical protein
METPREYYYTYYSYEEWGRGYFGSRKCYCLPEDDVKYFGSYKDKNFNPTQKIILKSDYTTREEAYIDEIILQRYYKVVENPHFANKAYQTSTKFSTFGLKHNENQKRTNSERWLGKNNPNYRDKENHSFFGKFHSEEWKKKQSERMKMNNPMKKIETSQKQSKSMKGKVPWNKGKKCEEYTGGKNPNAKKIIFAGNEYSSIKDAMKENKISYYLIKKNCTYLDK